jgi:Cu(I)/Ag(I) efflux system membrane fusion protein
MKRGAWIAISVAAIGAAGAVGYYAGASRDAMRVFASSLILASNASEPGKEVLYYRYPDGAPFYSLTPKKTETGANYVPVTNDRDVSPVGRHASKDASAKGDEQRILYYRNPMGLPDTSKVPKKDSMGMDYIPVYAGDAGDDSTVRVSLGKIQRSGVRSEPATKRVLSTAVRASGIVKLDERRQAVVSLRFEGWIEKVEDVTTGAMVRKGQPLMRVYGSALSAAAADYVSTRGFQGGDRPSLKGGSRQRLENLGVPAEIIHQIETSGKVPLTVVWPAPRDGIVLERNVTDGQRTMPGDVLFRLADISTVWVLADVAENDLPHISVGQSATIRLRGYPGQVLHGTVDLIYPEINMGTRTAKVRIELANPKGLLRPNMYAEVELAAPSNGPVLAVPDSAVIDNGSKRVVLVDKGNGRFEPRNVKTGQHGDSYVEIQDGLKENERVVVSANFLIDAESNLKSALSGMAEAEKTP